MNNYELMGQSLLEGLIVLIIGLITLRAYSIFYRGTRILSIRFKLFALRDDLGMLAVRGQVDEKSRAYTHIRELINASIGSCEKMDFVFFARAVSREISPDTSSVHDEILKTINDRPELIRIYGQTLERIMDSLDRSIYAQTLARFVDFFDRNSRFISYLLKSIRPMILDELNLARTSRQETEMRLGDVEKISPTAVSVG